MEDPPTSVTTTPATTNRQTAVSRSPNYPQLSIGPAMDRAKKIYEKEYTHPMPAQVAAEALGYKSLSGTAKGALSTLRKYGFLTFDGKDGYKVSNDTVAISELPPDDPERNAAIRRSASRPAAFKQLSEKYGATLPSEGAIRHFLIQSGYQSDGANLLIKVYKETLDFLTKLPLTPSPEEAQQPDTEVKPETPPVRASVSTATPIATPAAATIPTGPETQEDASNADSHKVRLSSKCTVEIIFRGEVTTEAISNMKGYLDWALGAYPSEALQPKPSITKEKAPVQSPSLFNGLEDDEDLEEDDMEEDEGDE